MRGWGRSGSVRAMLLVSVCVAMGVIASSACGSVTSMLRAATGYSPSQVTVEPACVAARARDSTAAMPRRSRRSAGGRCGRSAARRARARRSSRREPESTVTESGPVAYTPQLLQQTYDTSWLSATAGAGATVAIVDAYGDPNALTDLDHFRSTDGLPAISHSACTPSTIASHSGAPCMVETTQTGTTTGLPGPDGWDVEESLDLDAVSSICPNCNILFIEASDSSDASLKAGDEEALKLGVKLISNSFGRLLSASDSGAWTTALESTG